MNVKQLPAWNEFLPPITASSQIKSYDYSAAVIDKMEHLGYRLVKDFRPDFVFVKR